MSRYTDWIDDFAQRATAKERAAIRKAQRAILTAMRNKGGLAGYVAILDASTRPRKVAK